MNLLGVSHDWAREVDREHLDRVRQESALFAAGGAMHLVLEVLAYAADEAQWAGTGNAVVTAHGDGSVSVADSGRGTDTRVDDKGRTVKKPVMATKDLRFFDARQPAVLPDQQPRRGMSVVTALSEWLVHTNRRRNGAWTQRYERGIPVTDLTPIASNGHTGTTVRFLPDAALVSDIEISVTVLRKLAGALGPHLAVEITDERR